MTFTWPVMLVFLLLIPLAIVFYVRLQRRRREIALHFGSFGFNQGTVGKTPGRNRHIPPALFLVGLSILIISFARPQMTVSLPKIESTIMLVFDVSGSMAADDLPPSRMEAAKMVARNFVQRQPAATQIGVVAFSDGGLVILAPSNNREITLEAIDRLGTQRGTSLGQGIFTSLQVLAAQLGLPAETQGPPEEGSPISPGMIPLESLQGDYSSTAVILLSDGENNEAPDPLEVAQAAADLGVRIHTVGIGSVEGAVLQVEGFSVHTQLNEAMLKQIAEMTGGTYYLGGNEEELENIYNSIDTRVFVEPEEMEVTSLFASASILIFLTGGLLSLIWFNRLP